MEYVILKNVCTLLKFFKLFFIIPAHPNSDKLSNPPEKKQALGPAVQTSLQKRGGNDCKSFGEGVGERILFALGTFALGTFL